MTLRILGLGGSLRRDSYNGALLVEAGRRLPPEAAFERFTGLGRVPPYDADSDSDPSPEPVEELRAAIGRADGILIATPEYNHSIPGQLKNAIDWASRPFPGNALRGTPVAVIGASTSMFGAVWAQAELRKVLGATGARVLDAELPVPSAHQAFEQDGSLRDPELRRRLEGIVTLLVEAAAEPGGDRSAAEARERRHPVAVPAR